MDRIGVKEFKDHVSQFLRRVRQGERLLITDRGAPVASLAPHTEAAEVRSAWELVDSGAATWKGGKPTGGARPGPARAIRGKTTAQMVLEDRR